jgi:hypothetical protein
MNALALSVMEMTATRRGREEKRWHVENPFREYTNISALLHWFPLRPLLVCLIGITQLMTIFQTQTPIFLSFFIRWANTSHVSRIASFAANVRDEKILKMFLVKTLHISPVAPNQFMMLVAAEDAIHYGIIRECRFLESHMIRVTVADGQIGLREI